MKSVTKVYKFYEIEKERVIFFTDKHLQISRIVNLRSPAGWRIAEVRKQEPTPRSGTRYDIIKRTRQEEELAKARLRLVL